MKAVFDAKINSEYDDRIEERYHFPARRDYLEVAQAAIGDWILYREPQRNKGRKGYIGAAKLSSVEIDPLNPKYAYAYVRDYFPFLKHVPFAGSLTGIYWEANLRLIGDRRRAGRAVHGRSMRLLSDTDFDAIVSAALGCGPTDDVCEILNASLQSEFNQQGASTGVSSGLDLSHDRKIQQILLNRKVRDANFRRIICEAYDNTCAVTGLHFLNYLGNAEVQAAHIWPVKFGGPDIAQNGLALSATIHWLFDNLLISLTDDLYLIFANDQIKDPLQKFHGTSELRVSTPRDRTMKPSLTYVRRHREWFEASKAAANPS